MSHKYSKISQFSKHNNDIVYQIAKIICDVYDVTIFHYQRAGVYYLIILPVYIILSLKTGFRINIMHDCYSPASCGHFASIDNLIWDRDS